MAKSLMDNGILGRSGWRADVEWATSESTRRVATQILAEHLAQRTEVVRNPHLDAEWAALAVRAPRLLDAVRGLIGSAVAVENTFLMTKWPGRPFEVPWHQDGIDERIELDPEWSVSAWPAVTDATVNNGCLHVVEGSQRCGYLPVGREAAHGAERGRATTALVGTDDTATAVCLRAGAAVLMDSRLLHRSGSNSGGTPRIGLNIRYVAPDGIRRRATTSPSLDPISGPGW
ncbi:phytanoyl-CoA dioxygenase family protein [Embleya sp. NPDC001921]